MKIILAITEDKYGCSAIAELIRKLEENKKIENEIKLDCHSMGGKGNIISAKTVRIVKISIFKGYDKIMIFVDSDNEDSQILENRIKDMLKRNDVDMNRVCIIVFNPHIEILLAPQENNPLEYLRTHDRYEKSDLPKRIRNIDLNTVYKLEVFQKIVKTLNDP
jgi:hypothetical protein